MSDDDAPPLVHDYVDRPVQLRALPDGLDPHLPLIDIAWWNTRELIHHVADMSTVRDLYAVRPTEGETP